VDVFAFAGWVVALLSAITLPWPVNVPIMALAYKIRRGSESLDLEPYEFWVRSTLAAAGLAGLTLALLILSFLLIEGAHLPAGPILLVLILAYLPAAVPYLCWTFAQDELVDGLGLFVLYVLIPGLPLFLIGWLMGLWSALARLAPWMFPS
jgi:hypothetical protein